MKPRYFLYAANLLLAMSLTLSCSVLEDAKKKIDDGKDKIKEGFQTSLTNGLQFTHSQGIPDGGESVIKGVQFIAADANSPYGTLIFTSSDELTKLYLQIEGEDGYYTKDLSSSDIANTDGSSYAYSVDLDFAPGWDADQQKVMVSGVSKQGKTSKPVESETTVIEKYDCSSNGGFSGGFAGFIGSFDMGRNSGSFKFEYDTYYVPDEITIYGDSKARGTPIFYFSGGDDGVETVRFNERIITVKVIGSASGTAWDFIVHCPN
jgi:hypothetical protein